MGSPERQGKGIGRTNAMMINNLINDPHEDFPINQSNMDLIAIHQEQQKRRAFLEARDKEAKELKEAITKSNLSKKHQERMIALIGNWQAGDEQ